MNHSLQSPSPSDGASDTAIHIAPQYAMFSVLIAYGIASTGWGTPYGAVAALALILCVGLYWWMNLRPCALLLDISLAFSAYAMVMPTLICFVFFSRSAALLGMAGASGAFLMNRIQMAMYTGAWQTVVETRSPIKRAFRVLGLALTHFGVVGAFAAFALVGGIGAGFRELHDAGSAASMTEAVPAFKNPDGARREMNARMAQERAIRNAAATASPRTPTNK